MPELPAFPRDFYCRRFGRRGESSDRRRYHHPAPSHQAAGAAEPDQFFDDAVLLLARQRSVRQHESQISPIENLGAGPSGLRWRAGSFQQELDIREPPLVDRPYRLARGNIVRGSVPPRHFQARPRSERAAQQINARGSLPSRWRFSFACFGRRRCLPARPSACAAAYPNPGLWQCSTVDSIGGGILLIVTPLVASEAARH
jgi:hypothetical protein